MSGPPTPAALLAAETRALLTRVDRLRPFVEQETMLPISSLLPHAMVAVERTLLTERARLRAMAQGYLAWLLGPGGGVAPSEQQRRFATLRLRLNDHLSLLDLFSDAITQRSENELGPWLSGMDVAAADALRVDGAGLPEVPILCYVDRGPGAAIRRIKTPLVGRVTNPVAMIRVPRERMVGHGIASSLFHEVGHQGAALLDLVEPLRRTLLERAGRGPDGFAWRCWAAWVSEIVADLWSVARLGVGSTLGLMGVVGLPRPFVFRFSLTDPHPFPWIRVLVSAGIGHRLYPDPQWRSVARIWRELYPVSGAPDGVAEAVGRLLPTVPELTAVLADHRPAALGGPTLGAALSDPSRRPEHLRQLRAATRHDPALAGRVRPALRFAALGQARWDGTVSADDEGREVAAMLTRWARQATLQMAAAAAALPPPGRPATTSHLPTRPPSAAAPRRVRSA